MKKFFEVTMCVLVSLTLFSCNQNDEGRGGYLEEISNLNKLWTVAGGFQNNQVRFSAVDLTNPNSVIVYDVELNGQTSDCTYSSQYAKANSFYGVFTFDSIAAGDQQTCEQLESVNYAAALDTRKNRETVSIRGVIVQ